MVLPGRVHMLLKIGDRVRADKAPILDREIWGKTGTVTSTEGAEWRGVRVLFDEGSLSIPVHIDELVLVEEEEGS